MSRSWRVFAWDDASQCFLVPESHWFIAQQSELVPSKLFIMVGGMN